jgi:hypothetical protein
MAGRLSRSYFGADAFPISRAGGEGIRVNLVHSMLNHTA